jgi:hypothetical protein
LAVTRLRRWGAIREYVKPCRQRGYFTEAFCRKAAAHTERIHMWRRLRQATDGRGWPILANVVREGHDGWPKRVCLQEELFDPKEYRQMVASHDGLARHHLVKARTSCEHAKRRFGVQLPLFDEDDGGADGL